MRLILIFFIFISNSFISQKNLDSLWGVWKNESQPDSNRMQAIQLYSWFGFLFSDPDSAFYFAQMHLEYAIKVGDKKNMSKAYDTQGMSHYFLGDYSKAMNYLNKSLQLSQELGNKAGIANTSNNIGLIFFDKGNYAEAIKAFKKSLKNHEYLNNTKGIASVYNNIGNIYQRQKEYVKALEYYNKSLQIKQKIGDKKGIANALGNIAIIHKASGNYLEAIKSYNECLKIHVEANDLNGIAVTQNNMGLVHQNMGDSYKALKYFRQSLSIRKELGDRPGMATTLINIGILFKEDEKYTKAIQYTKEGLYIAQEIASLVDIKTSSMNLWDTYKKIGMYQSSLEMYEIYVKAKDSLDSDKNQKEVIKQELKYEYEKNATADSILASEAIKVKDAQLIAEKAKSTQQSQELYFLIGCLVLVVAFGVFIFKRFIVINKQKEVIQIQKNKVENAYTKLDEKNKEIFDSLNYAKRIQRSILPKSKLFKEHFNDSFIMFKPKDIVSGDFYWIEPYNNEVLFAVADCTGHGVPGALVSVLCNNALSRSVKEYGLSEPGEILDKTREIIVKEFEKSEEEVKDGMDIALCSLNVNQLKYSGAHNPLWIIQNGELIEIKANKQPIGKFDKQENYTTYSIDLEKGDCIYLFSDGYADQFGGVSGKKFKVKNLRELLLRVHDKKMDNQQEIIDDTFEKWKGELDQIDDVCILGIRI